MAKSTKPTTERAQVTRLIRGAYEAGAITEQQANQAGRNLISGNLSPAQIADGLLGVTGNGGLRNAAAARNAVAAGTRRKATAKKKAAAKKKVVKVRRSR